MYRKTIIVVVLALGCLGAACALEKKEHYEFILPDHYIGWIKIVFNDKNAPLQQKSERAWLVPISDDGLFFTRSMRVLEILPQDSFYYRISQPNGSMKLELVPQDYVMNGTDHGGFDISESKDRAWFIFIGPPEIRAEVPFADWPKELASRKQTYGTADLGPPKPLPIPGRFSKQSQIER